jgi:hypothetical protein
MRILVGTPGAPFTNRTATRVNLLKCWESVNTEIQLFAAILQSPESSSRVWRCLARRRAEVRLQETTVLPSKHEPEEVFYQIGAIWIAYSCNQL